MEDGFVDAAAASSADDSPTPANEPEIVPIDSQQEEQGPEKEKDNGKEKGKGKTKPLPDSSEIEGDPDSEPKKNKVNPLVFVAFIMDLASRHKGHIIAAGLMVHCFLAGNRGLGLATVGDIYVAICLLTGTTSLSSGKLKEATQGISNFALLLKNIGSGK